MLAAARSVAHWPPCESASHLRVRGRRGDWWCTRRHWRRSAEENKQWWNGLMWHTGHHKTREDFSPQENALGRTDGLSINLSTHPSSVFTVKLDCMSARLSDLVHMCLCFRRDRYECNTAEQHNSLCYLLSLYYPSQSEHVSLGIVTEQ